MPDNHLKIAFVRRGFSRSGGAEAYLKRLARGLMEAGHEAQLCTTSEWPADEWPFGELTHLRGKTPRVFADEVERIRRMATGTTMMSLERVWSCDVYRAGDGVHAAWSRRRAEQRGFWTGLTSGLNRKHAAIIRLEESLFAEGRAGRVIANSQMVKEEITQYYRYPAERIDVVPNGVPLAQFAPIAEQRASARKSFALASEDVALLFVGSGWERKGLATAIRAVEKLNQPKLKLLVAGRGKARKYRSASVQITGEIADVTALYQASDIFILPTLYDPFSNACLEALASGLPVITTSSNGFAEVIDEGVHG
ncbi:MAG: glycosyltransferase family 4 protein, partial [Verrucomicrobiota bacterium]|nr:glycosyltransferase family 4 protein [Verrucomicrobiota bacterium]